MTTDYDLFIGWDIGGAHVKVACLNQHGDSVYIKQSASPIWLGLDVLKDVMAQQLSAISRQFPLHSKTHGLTMTAELSDIFPDRQTGVMKIYALIKHLIREDAFYVYAGDHGFVQHSAIASHWCRIASANWHATASLIARHHEYGVLVDFGSTTTDLIPFEKARVTARGYTDHQRLTTNELLYTGMIRTPVMAIANKIEYSGKRYNIMAELFATMADVYRLTGDLNEDDDDMTSADGNDKTFNASLQRLARMIGVDSPALSECQRQDIVEMARDIMHRQLTMIQSALDSVRASLNSKHDALLVAAGCGRKLLQNTAEQCNMKYIEFSLANTVAYSPALAAQCAAAVAVAELLRLNDDR